LGIKFSSAPRLENPDALAGVTSSKRNPKAQRRVRQNRVARLLAAAFQSRDARDLPTSEVWRKEVMPLVQK
jgi:hypothetical protein